MTVADFERGIRRPVAATLTAIRRALESAGVALVTGGAVLREHATEAVGDSRLAECLRALQSAEPMLRELGVRRLSIFGSTARGAARPESDLDLLLELDPRKRLDLLDYAGIVGELQRLVPQKVDVARRDRLKPHVAPAALRDEIRVF